MERLPPQSIEIERAVLGALMYDKNAFDRVADILDVNCFYNPIHKFIFEGMLELKSKNIDIDILTLSQHFENDKDFKDAGGTYFLSECIDSVTSSAMLESHLKTIKEQSRQRNVIQACNKFLESEDYSAGIDILQECIEKNLVSEYYEKLNKITKLGDAIAKTISDNKNDIGTSGHEEFLMEEVPEGTKINYTYDVELKNPLFRIFGRFLIGWYAMRFWKRAVIDKLKEMLEK